MINLVVVRFRDELAIKGDRVDRLGMNDVEIVVLGMITQPVIPYFRVR